jgi:hypothetical protein
MKKEELDEINSLIGDKKIEIVADGDNFKIKEKKPHNPFFNDPIDGYWYKILAQGGFQSSGSNDMITYMSVDIKVALQFAKNYQNELYEFENNRVIWLLRNKQALCDHTNTKQCSVWGSVPTQWDECLDCGKHINVRHIS